MLAHAVSNIVMPNEVFMSITKLVIEIVVQDVWPKSEAFEFMGMDELC